MDHMTRGKDHTTLLPVLYFWWQTCKDFYQQDVFGNFTNPIPNQYRYPILDPNPPWWQQVRPEQ